MNHRLASLLLGLTVAACGTDVAVDSPAGGASGEDVTLPPDAGAPEMTPAPEDGPPTFAWLQANIFTPSCASSTCHGAAAHGGLTLVAGQAYAQLVNVPASSASGWMRVVPSAPEQSYLLVALGKENGPLPEDGYMPLGAPMLSAEKLDAVERWVAAGAKP